MERQRYLAALSDHAEAFASALERAPDAPVSGCPGWNVADLAVHLGVTHRWATEIVRTAATEPVRGRQRFATTADDPGLAAWLRAGAVELAAVLASARLDEPAWSWMPASTTAFWCRRMAHETAVHRWDASTAAGQEVVLDPELSSDGIDEVLTVFAAGRSRSKSTVVASGESFHFHCTDVPGEWTVRFDGSGVDVRSEHAKGDVAARGRAEDLLLFLWGRIPAGTLDVVGDAGLLGRWTELVPPV